ncbi:glycosyltransferase family 4 protein [Aeromonas caviae]|uniref:glycosyltransferase family 4 protein n=1 Tax=Aeromonas caviae TaxID=648 RepID=UPI001CF0A0D1|nr:glycosyltransferase family 4 protein [Aeromonas caviae]UCM48855.1 glycosyltransferase family 4 protein [Aeromonas caviae]
MKYIVYICSTLERTGPTSQLYNIISALNLESYQAKVITLSPEKNNTLYDKFISSGIDVRCIDPDGKKNINELRELIIKLLVSDRVAVVHTQGIRADIIMSKAVKVLNVKWIATLRNIPYLDYPPQYGVFKGALMALLHLLSLRQCENVVVVSHAVKSVLKRFFKRDIHVIANGIDTDYYSLDNISRDICETLRKNYSFDIDTKLIVYTGVLEERKNIHMMLNVFEKLNDFKLLLIGDGSLMPMVKMHSATLKGKVIPVGSVPDVRPYLAVADSFILISKAEGLPNSVLEALAMNVPSILSNIGPHLEIQQSASSLVHIVDISDENELSDFFGNAYDTWRDNIKNDACRILAEKDFSSIINSKNYQCLYQ